jgi:hypothetical protein
MPPIRISQWNKAFKLTGLSGMACSNSTSAQRARLDKDAAEDDDDELLRELKFVGACESSTSLCLYELRFWLHMTQREQWTGTSAPAYFDFGTQVMTAVLKPSPKGVLSTE